MNMQYPGVKNRLQIHYFASQTCILKIKSVLIHKMADPFSSTLRHQQDAKIN